jgi:hypothetical protein
MGALPGGAGGRDAEAAGEAEEDVLEGRALDHQLADPDAAVDQPPVEGLGGGAVQVDGQPVGPALAQPHPGQGRRQLRRRAHVRGGDQHPPGRPEQRLHPVLGDQSPPVHDRRPGADQLDLGQQVAGQEHRGPARDQLDQQVPDLPHAVRVEPVGRLVQDQQPRRPQ